MSGPVDIPELLAAKAELAAQKKRIAHLYADYERLKRDMNLLNEEIGRQLRPYQEAVDLARVRREYSLTGWVRTEPYFYRYRLQRFGVTRRSWDSCVWLRRMFSHDLDRTVWALDLTRTPPNYHRSNYPTTLLKTPATINTNDTASLLVLLAEADDILRGQGWNLTDLEPTGGLK